MCRPELRGLGFCPVLVGRSVQCEKTAHMSNLRIIDAVTPKSSCCCPMAIALADKLESLGRSELTTFFFHFLSFFKNLYPCILVRRLQAVHRGFGVPMHISERILEKKIQSMVLSISYPHFGTTSLLT